MSPVPEAVRSHFKALNKVDLRLVGFCIKGLFLAEVMIFLPLVALSLDSFSPGLQQSVLAYMCDLLLALGLLLCF